MNYEAFRELFGRALREVGLAGSSVFPEEKIYLGAMSRECVIRLGIDLPFMGAEPFMVFCKVDWVWDALQSARTETSEDDALIDILGLGEASKAVSMKRLLQVNVEFSASLPDDGLIPLPHRSIWERWLREVSEEVEPLLSVDAMGEKYEGTSFWCGKPTGEIEFSPESVPVLSGVALKSWQGVYLPRVWDGENRAPDPDPTAAVFAYAGRIKRAIQRWMECVKVLRIGEVSVP